MALPDVSDSLEDGEDVIVRVYTDEHLVGTDLPDSEINEMIYRMVPFKHYLVTSAGALRGPPLALGGDHRGRQAGLRGARSPTGSGKIIYEMCHRYGTRSEFRNYTMLDDMIGDSILHLLRAVLKVDEYRTDSRGRNATNAFSFMTACIHRKFLEVIDRRKRQLKRDAKMVDPSAPGYESEGDIAEREHESAEEAWKKFREENPEMGLDAASFDWEAYQKEHLEPSNDL